MNYAEIKKCDISNGPGIRVSLFVSGCDHHCKNCFNPETWDYNYGQPFTNKTVMEIIALLKPDNVSGLTLLGGDPLMSNNIKDVADLCCIVKTLYPKKTIWCFTGYTWEYLMVYKKKNDYLNELLKYVDVIVDGPYIEEQKDLMLKFRGSKNQRIIDVQKAIREINEIFTIND